MVDKEPVSLVASKLLIVEGRDEDKLIESFLGHLGLSGIQILPMGGKTTTRSNLLAIRDAKNFDSLVKDLGIIRDADFNCEDTFKSICDSLKNAKLPVPSRLMAKTSGSPSIQVMVLPDNSEPGELEDVCVRALDENSQKCIDAFITCMKSFEQFKSDKVSLSKVYAFISACEKPWLRLGESAKCGYWDFDHPAFSQIAAFLRSL